MYQASIRSFGTIVTILLLVASGQIVSGCAREKVYVSYLDEARIWVDSEEGAGLPVAGSFHSDCVVKLIEWHRPVPGDGIVITYVRASGLRFLVTDAERFEILSVYVPPGSHPSVGEVIHTNARVLYSEGSLHGAHRCVGSYSDSGDLIPVSLDRSGDRITVSVDTIVMMIHASGRGEVGEVQVRLSFSASPGDWEESLGIVGDLWDAYIARLRDMH